MLGILLRANQMLGVNITLILLCTYVFGKSLVLEKNFSN